ncbi:MAG: M48 family metalloprotease [Candidatus Omnitrophica bacterium]|nr:M48 family metalloprotease [Candidatus Omnitrophota bacterium]
MSTDKNTRCHIFFLFLLFFLAGCATEFNLATGREETLFYGTEKEVRIGDSVAKQVEEKYKISTDIDINERVEKILSRIVAVCDRKNIVYLIKVIDEDKVNAVSLPGGYIYIFKGLIDRVENDEQLAGVIAHEVAHITARHGIKKMQSVYGYSLMQAAAVASGEGEVVKGVSAAFSTLFFSYSRQDEFQADKLAVKYLQKAGYDPKEIIGMLNVLKAEQEKAPLRQLGYFRTHPHIEERKAIVNQEITGELEFKDYLNLTGQDL